MSTLTLTLNIEIFAPTQYLNYPFNSMCEFNGVVLGASDTGIYHLETGGLDDNVPIDALVEFPRTDLGVRHLKHPRRVVINGRSAGNLLLTTSADDGPEITQSVRARNPGRYSVMFEYFNREQRGMYFDFRLENVGGAYFSIDSIDFDVIPIAMRETPA